MTRRDLMIELAKLGTDEATNLFRLLANNKITLEEAIEQYNSLMIVGANAIELPNDNYANPWLARSQSKPKIVYQSLKKFYNGKLDAISTTKMISSIITHLLIEISNHDDNDHTQLINQYGLSEFTDLLSEIIYTGINDDTNRITKDLLDKYQYSLDLVKLDKEDDKG